MPGGVGGGVSWETMASGNSARRKRMRSAATIPKMVGRILSSTPALLISTLLNHNKMERSPICANLRREPCPSAQGVGSHCARGCPFLPSSVHMRAGTRPWGGRGRWAGRVLGGESQAVPSGICPSIYISRSVANLCAPVLFDRCSARAAASTMRSYYSHKGPMVIALVDRRWYGSRLTVACSHFRCPSAKTSWSLVSRLARYGKPTVTAARYRPFTDNVIAQTRYLIRGRCSLKLEQN